MATWTPTWQANTAYALDAVVIPSSFGGYTWYCTTAGTSGLVEPTWPDPKITPTVTDNTVTWTVGSGFRQAIQSGVVTIMTAFSAANPTIVRSVRTVRPRTFTTADLPVFFVGDLNEDVTTSQGTRQRKFSGFSAYLVDFLGEQAESNDRMNFAADVLLDYFTRKLRAASGSSNLQVVAIHDTEFDEGGVRYPALEFVFGETLVLEGRT